VPRQVVYEHHGRDGHPHLDQRLRWRSDVEQQQGILARRIERFRRLSLGQDVAVDPGWPTLHRAVTEAVQLDRGREHVVEARHVAVVHQVQIALERRTETCDTFIVEAHAGLSLPCMPRP